MLRKTVEILSAFLLATLILAASLVRTSSIKYAFYDQPATPSPASISSCADEEIDYSLPYPGSILPDSPLWYLKAARDRVTLALTFDLVKKAQKALFLADKRMAASKELFENGNAEVGYSTLTRAHKYFQQAYELEKKGRGRGISTTELQKQLANASLKYWQVGEQILVVAPEDARPGIVRLLDMPKEVYSYCSRDLEAKGINAPKNPFN